MIKLCLKTAVVLMALYFILIAPAVGEEQNALEDVRNTKDVIATFGVMPKDETDFEFYNWQTSIYNITKEIAEDKAFEQYIFFGGLIDGYGPFEDGTIHIFINKNFRDCVTDDELMDELMEIAAIVEKYAEKEGIESIPIVFSVMGSAAPAAAEYQKTSSPYTSYQNRYKPLIGGIMFTTSDSSGPKSHGSVGFMAEDDATGVQGFVTAAHVFGFTDRDAHQPTYNSLLPVYSRVGTSNITYNNTDAVFVPYNNVEAKIFYQNDTTLGNYTVGGYFNERNIGEEVTKSGYVTGLQNATIVGYVNDMNMTHPSWEVYGYPRFDRVGVLNANILDNGDSGAPIFQVLEEYDGKAYIVGIAFASGNNTTYFIPCQEIRDKLGITPLMQ